MDSLNDVLRSKGSVFITVDDITGGQEFYRENTVLIGGREALARVITGQMQGTNEYWISHMVFGSGGYVDDGSSTRRGPVEFPDGRTSLFAPIQSGEVQCTPSPVREGSYRATFTGILSSSMANGNSISEMGLKLKNGALFAMTTFPPIAKNNQRIITVRWTISFLSGS